MPDTRPAIALLASRALLRLSGADTVSFLQGLVSSDVRAVAPGRPRYAALLTPQGKYLFDMLLVADGDGLLLDTERHRMEALAAALGRYRLRAKVTIAPDPRAVAVVWPAPSAGVSDAPAPDVLFEDDPRLPALGRRLYGPAAALAALWPDLPRNEEAAYAAHRLDLGVPEGEGAFLPGQDFLLECNFDELHGVDFRKGCYVGQELTARMKHRGTARRRILKVRAQGPLPPAGTPVLAGALEIGTLRVVAGADGLAQLRLDRIADAGLSAGGVALAVVPSAYTLPLAPGDAA